MQVCSLGRHLCCCPANRFISTITFFVILEWNFKVEYAMYSLVSGVFQSDYFEIHHVILYISNFFTSQKIFHYSVQSLSCVDSLRPHEPQLARPPCPSPIPRVHPNPCPLSQWCHPTISSSVIPFSSCPQTFPASRSFQMSQLSASGGQSIGASASTSVPPMNTQDRSPLG